jgi:hypothetical protein
VVAETTQVAPLRRIDKFSSAEGHEIEVFDPFFIVLSRASPKLGLVDDFADILENELVRSQISLGTETEPFLFCLDDRDICILSALKSLILAFSAAAAVTHALDFGSAIDTIRIFSTC